MPLRTLAVALAATLLAAAPAALAAGGSPAVPAGPIAAAVPPRADRVDVNTASTDVLVTVPGIGPRTAQAIVDLRARKGSFQRLEELLEVRGIGEQSLAKLARHLVVLPQAPAMSSPK